MAVYSEKELKYARPIANAFLFVADFRYWILAGTRHEREFNGALPISEVEAKSLRSPTIRNPYWFNYWCPKDSKCTCRIGSGIETDILIVSEQSPDRRLGVHFEIKRPDEKLGDGQALSYSRRAACWTNSITRPRTVPVHQEYLTVLVCGPELVTAIERQSFDKIVFHDEMAVRISPYPEP